MQLLTSLFPPDDFSLVAVVLGLPLLGAMVNGLFGKRLGNEAVRLLALVVVGGSFLASLASFLMLADSGENASFTYRAWHFIDLSRAGGTGVASIDVAFVVDRLSSVMMLIVTGVGFLIHVYATSYMQHDHREELDGGYHRFFAYLNLFIFAMLVLVMGSSLPILFVGWEGVVLCSYLLIGFWYSDAANASAGKKAFVVNRIGDFGLLVAMAMLLNTTGALDFKGMGMAASGGALLERVKVWPLGPHGFVGPLTFLNHDLTPTIATVAALMLFLGCVGKSAQIPLYVWLPDAMAGPTPVSALIHAATMVTAGVYLVCRMSFVFLLSPIAMAVVAFTGALTALFAATIGLAQTDIKKVLAYSTVSQLGYMFLGVGVGAFSAGLFHVMTHAFFKACLFLGAGSVIHAMHARVHDTAASQDMRNMGGLRKWMPLTYASFLASCIAIAGIFPLSGFFSKDAILFYAVANRVDSHDPSRWKAEPWFSWMLYAMGLAAAVLTAFYMFRALYLTFHGEFRGWKVDPGAEAGAHGQEATLPEPRESPRAMSWVLVVLGALAALGGFANAGVLSKKMTLFDDWLAPIFRGAETIARTDEHAASEVGLAVVGVLAGALGLALAYWVYIAKKGEPARAVSQKVPRLFALVRDKWRIDELYDKTVVAFVDALADTAAAFDKWVVDGIIARVTALVVALFGTILRAFQTGAVHVYATFVAIGIFAMGIFFVWQPQARVTIADATAGRLTVEAAPGLGYTYRWRTGASTDRSDRGVWSSERTLSLEVPPGQKKTVVLEVKNAFDRTAARTIVVERPSSGAPREASR
jgi:NADH-quinone oxidoreductase subunit L